MSKSFFGVPMGRKKKSPDVRVGSNESAESEARGSDDASDVDAGDIDTAEFEATLSELSAGREEAERERDEYRNQLLRLKADFDNYRRRSRNELADARADATMDVIARWLPVIENLERAHEAAEGEANVDALREGLGLVQKSLADALRNEGVTTVDPRGQRYDERCMEAVGLTPHPDVDEGHVVEVLQRGRMLGERLIQAARVIVSAGPPSGESGGDGAEDAESEKGE